MKLFKHKKDGVEAKEFNFRREALAMPYKSKCKIQQEIEESIFMQSI